MKKDFQKFQNDFYAEVQNTLTNFYEKVNVLQATLSPCVLDPERNMLEVNFSFTDVTGKERYETVHVENTTDVKAAVAELNSILKEDYPAFAQYKDLEDVIKTAVEVKDPDNTYTYTIQGTEHSTGHFKVYDLTFQMDCDTLCVTGESRDGDEFEDMYVLGLWNPANIAIDIEFNLFQEA